MRREHLVQVVWEGNLLQLPDEVTNKAWSRILQADRAERLSGQILFVTTALAVSLAALGLFKNSGHP